MLVHPCELGAVFCCLVMVTAADRAAATCLRWKQDKPPPKEQLGFEVRGCFCLLVHPCELGAFSCCWVMVTAADRAAATCLRWK